MTSRMQQFQWHRQRMRDAIADMLRTKEKIRKLYVERTVHGYFDDGYGDPIDALEADAAEYRKRAKAEYRRCVVLRRGVGWQAMRRAA